MDKKNFNKYWENLEKSSVFFTTKELDISMKILNDAMSFSLQGIDEFHLLKENYDFEKFIYEFEERFGITPDTWIYIVSWTTNILNRIVLN